jgi:hypothetical protein
VNFPSRIGRVASSCATTAIVNTLAPKASLSRRETNLQIWPRRDQTLPISLLPGCGGGTG